MMKPESVPQIDPKLMQNPIFQRVMADALAIQHRFAAEPVYAKTGKGYLKSEGVEELQRLKERKQTEGN
jgi:citrate lyase synthetase